MSRTLTNALLIAALLACMALPANALLKKGETLPQLNGTTIDGNAFNSEQLKGKPVLLKLGTTWCGTCGAQSQAISQLQDYLQQQQIEVVDIFIKESAKQVRSYFAGKGLQQPDTVLLDDGSIARQLNVYAIPRVLLIDKNQRIYRDGADLSKTGLQKQLDQMLAEY